MEFSSNPETTRYFDFSANMVQEVDGINELEIGYSHHPAFWGKGYATEAAQKCRDFAFENNFAETLISIVHVDNTASAKVATRNGMKLEKTTVYKEIPVNIFRIQSPFKTLAKLSLAIIFDVFSSYLNFFVPIFTIFTDKRFF